MSAPPESSARQPTILVVEDHPGVRRVVIERLERATPGAVVLGVSSAEEGLRVLAQREVDLIVSDNRMPGMDGVTFLTRARELRPGTARVLLSGDADASALSRAVNQGRVDAFFEKPALGDEFERETSRLLLQARHADDDEPIR